MESFEYLLCGFENVCVFFDVWVVGGGFFLFRFFLLFFIEVVIFGF